MNKINMKETFTICKASAGCGKTYTLAARYVALLFCGQSFRSILAVTFTNKATAEMKERILMYLYMIAKFPDTDKERATFLELVNGYIDEYSKCGMKRVCTADDEVREEALKNIHDILANYDDMTVSTIDSFLQSLITGMARMLNIGAGFSVELDSKKVVTDAVNQIMTDSQNDKGLVSLLVSYINSRIDEGKPWNIRKDLVSFGNMMLKESVQKDDKAIVSDSGKINAYKQEVFWKKHPEIIKMQQLYNKVLNSGELDNIPSSKTFVERMGKNLEGTEGDGIFLPKKFKDKLNDTKFIAKISKTQSTSDVARSLQEMVNLCPACRKVYIDWKLTGKKLNDLSFMGFIKKQIDGNLEDSNSILLARTAYVLSEALKPGDADFILERAGIRYKHIMIDEFQDTSELQWNVFAALVKNILGECNTALVVGDIKQSIYRWRNSNYEIMEKLCGRLDPALSPYTKDEQKTCNFRSRRNVVEFNLKAFHDMVTNVVGCPIYGKEEVYLEGYDEAKNNISSYYRNDKEGGFVQLKSYLYGDGTSYVDKDEARKKIMEDMFKQIDALLRKGAKANDMLILIRENKEAALISDALNDMRNNPDYSDCTNLKDLILISNDSFYLKSSQSVNILIEALKYYHYHDSIAKEYLQMQGVNNIDALSSINSDMPLYELMEELVRLFLCDEHGKFKGTDAAYVSCLLDYCQSFVESSGSDVESFLLYWEDSLCHKSMPAGSGNGVKIMTIHSAKGLERKSVFIPFCSWEIVPTSFFKKPTLWLQAVLKSKDGNVGLVPIEMEKDVDSSSYKGEFDKEVDCLRVDAFNLLYVALTRAADNLWVSVDVDTKNQSVIDNNVGYWLLKSKGYEVIPTPKDLEDCSMVWGEEPHVEESKSDDRKEKTPFDQPVYDGSTKIKVGLVSDNFNIQFRQSQESKQYLTRGMDGLEKWRTHIEFGNICHDILAQIETANELNKVLDAFVQKGVVGQSQDVEQIRQRLQTALSDEQMAQWFDGSWQLLREVGIVKPRKMYDSEMEAWRKASSRPSEEPSKELRPDRVMIDGDKAIVLDYKFGDERHDKTYFAQVKQYMNLLRQMGYADVKGYIWYDCEQKTVEVK